MKSKAIPTFERVKTIFKLKYIDGLEQTPPDLDFHITPVLTFGYSDDKELGHLGSAKGLFIEWGHWAIGIAMYRVFIYKK